MTILHTSMEAERELRKTAEIKLALLEKEMAGKQSDEATQLRLAGKEEPNAWTRSTP